MWRVICFIMVVCFSGSLLSQSMLPVFYDTIAHDGQLSFNGGAFYHTSSIQNGLGDKFIFGGHITDEEKEASFDKMENFNTFGGDLSGELVYYHGKTVFSKYPDLSWKVSFGNSTVFGAEYHKDVFGLLMFGNKRYINQQANLNNSYAFYYSGTKLGVGLYNRKTKSAFTANAVMVNNYWKVDMEQASFYTDSNGDELFVIGIGGIGVTSGDFYSGMGFSFDLDHYIPIRSEGLMNGFVQLTARNIGVARLSDWNITELAGTLNYQGFDFSSLTAQTDANFVDQVKDSLEVRSSSGSQWILLPGLFQIGKIVDAHSEQKLQSFFGARAYLTTVYRPMVFFGLHYRFSKNFAAGSQIAYGGFGGIRFGTYVSYTKDKLTFSLATEDALGALHSRQYGQSVLIGINWKF